MWSGLGSRTLLDLGTASTQRVPLCVVVVSASRDGDKARDKNHRAPGRHAGTVLLLGVASGHERRRPAGRGRRADVEDVLMGVTRSLGRTGLAVFAVVSFAVLVAAAASPPQVAATPEVVLSTGSPHPSGSPVSGGLSSPTPSPSRSHCGGPVFEFWGIEPARVTAGNAPLISGGKGDTCREPAEPPQHVEVLARPAGAQEFAIVATATTDDQGYFSVAIRPGRTTDYRVTIDGQPVTCPAAYDKNPYVSGEQRSICSAEVHTRVMFESAPGEGTVALAGTLLPRYGGKQVGLAERVAGRCVCFRDLHVRDAVQPERVGLPDGCRRVEVAQLTLR